MATEKSNYICKECGFVSPKWMGRCSNCGAWNSFIEKNEDIINKEFDIKPLSLSKIEITSHTRFLSGIDELDRVLGGGIVAGSLILLGGAPGIGKSTLILQVASLFSNRYGNVLYVSGEESARQIKMRAERLNSVSDNLMVLAETNYSKISYVLKKNPGYRLIILDSIQTIYQPKLDSSPGSINQVKEISNDLLKYAKRNEISVVMIGHVTKEGNIAGPRVLEHIVDTVLQFEGDSNNYFRILRSIKNRFGSSNEIGVFRMGSKGMKEVKNPSQLFLAERPEGAAGSVIVPVIEGSRTILIEVQALVSGAAFGNSRRITMGLDSKRLSILLAVLEKKAGLNLQNMDVQLNITGGLKANEPALDLAMITAILSSYREYALPPDLAVIGEVGLAGEVRAVSQLEKRLAELIKLNFKRVIIPKGNKNKLKKKMGINLKGISDIRQLISFLFKE